MADLMSALYGNYSPDAMAQYMMQQRMAQQRPSAPVNLTMGGVQNADYQNVDNSDPYAQPAPQPRVRASLPIQVPSPAFEPTSGSAMEATAHSSIDDLMAKLEAQRNQSRQQDRDQQWMSFFSKLASSKSNTLLGGLGEGAQALSDTTVKQGESNKLLDRAAIEDQIKYQEWNREQARQEAAQKSTEAYQKGELGLRGEALKQGKYQMSPYGQVLNTKTGELTSNGGLGLPANSLDANGQPLTGEAYLATLDPQVATLAKSYANGDVAWPSGFALKNPMVLQATIAAKQYDSTANGNRFPAVNKFNTGKQGDQVRAFDVGISHLNTLSTLADGLDNKDTNLVNKAANAWKQQTGEEAPTDFNAAKEVVGNEIVKAIVGAGGGVGDREKAQQALNAANSPAQLKGVIKTYKTLMSGQLGGLKQQYENSTGRKDFYDRLSPTSRTEMVPASTAPAAVSGAAPDSSIALQHAKEAIAAGAPRDAVIQRLKSMNVSTDGL